MKFLNEPSLDSLGSPKLGLFTALQMGVPGTNPHKKKKKKKKKKKNS
jgi:hypothetical protein